MKRNLQIFKTIPRKHVENFEKKKIIKANSNQAISPQLLVWTACGEG